MNTGATPFSAAKAFVQLIQEAQEFVCGDADLHENTGAEAMYTDAKARLHKKITEVFENKESFVACLASAKQQAVQLEDMQQNCVQCLEWATRQIWLNT